MPPVIEKEEFIIVDIHPNYWKPRIDRRQRNDEKVEVRASPCYTLFPSPARERYSFTAPFNYVLDGVGDEGVFSFRMEGTENDLQVYIAYEDKRIYNLTSLIPWPFHVPVEAGYLWGLWWDKNTGRPTRITTGKCDDATEGMLSFLHEVGHIALFMNDPVRPIDPYKLEYRDPVTTSVDSRSTWIQQEKKERNAWYFALTQARKVARKTGIPLFESRALHEVHAYIDSFIESHQKT